MNLTKAYLKTHLSHIERNVLQVCTGIQPIK